LRASAIVLSLCAPNPSHRAEVPPSVDAFRRISISALTQAYGDEGRAINRRTRIGMEASLDPVGARKTARRKRADEGSADSRRRNAVIYGDRAEVTAAVEAMEQAIAG
jgi:hypothetical protein